MPILFGVKKWPGVEEKKAGLCACRIGSTFSTWPHRWGLKTQSPHETPRLRGCQQTKVGVFLEMSGSLSSACPLCSSNPLAHTPMPLGFSDGKTKAWWGLSISKAARNWVVRTPEISSDSKNSKQYWPTGRQTIFDGIVNSVRGSDDHRAQWLLGMQYVPAWC